LYDDHDASVIAHLRITTLGFAILAVAAYEYYACHHAAD